MLGLGQKDRNVHPVEMSNGTGKWDGSLVVLRTQAERCLEFHEPCRGSR